MDLNGDGLTDVTIGGLGGAALFWYVCYNIWIYIWQNFPYDSRPHSMIRTLAISSVYFLSCCAGKMQVIQWINASENLKNKEAE